MTSYRFLTMAAAVAQYYFRCRVCWCHCLQKAKIYQQISFTAEIWLLPVWKNKRPSYWNSTSGFIFNHFTVIAVLFCVRFLHFVQIGPPTAVIWHHIDFATWRSSPLNTTSGFVIVDVSAFRRSKCISKPHFFDISPFTAELLLLTVWKNKRPPYWNSISGFDLKHFAVIGVLFCIRLPNFVQIGPASVVIWRHIDVQDGGRQPCCICFGGNGRPPT